MAGRIWVETEDMAPFNGKYDDAGKKKDSSAQVTDKEMEDLFNSIDADGSGAIDVEELSYALEMMGMPMADDQVQVRQGTASRATPASLPASLRMFLPNHPP